MFTYELRWKRASRVAGRRQVERRSLSPCGHFPRASPTKQAVKSLRDSQDFLFHLSVLISAGSRAHLEVPRICHVSRFLYLTRCHDNRVELFSHINPSEKQRRWFTFTGLCVCSSLAHLRSQQGSEWRRALTWRTCPQPLSETSSLRKVIDSVETHHWQQTEPSPPHGSDVPEAYNTLSPVHVNKASASFFMNLTSSQI